MDPKFFEIVREDPRYAPEAYEFVCDAVTYTQERLGRVPLDEDAQDEEHHVCGAELVEGACELAIREFGMMAPVVFKLWGIRKSDDVGEIVFNLIRANKLSKSDRDDLNDFRDLFPLEVALTRGFELTTAEYAPRKAGER